MDEKQNLRKKNNFKNLANHYRGKSASRNSKVLKVLLVFIKI